MARANPPAPASGPRVVIVGGGFGGLTAARALRRAPVHLTLIDRRNHHLFQPLLYQVATAALSATQIAAPIRHVLAAQRNCRVIMAEARRVDTARRVVVLADDEAPYDCLVLAAGATHSYFGHDDWAPHAPGLKTVDDALEIRRRLLLAFERAERRSDPDAQRPDLTFVIVGAGPTGVEMAGAICEIALKDVPRDFRRVDPATTRVLLVEAQARVLPTFPEALSQRAARDLADLGVELHLRTRVTHVDAESVTLESDRGAERVRSRNVIWGAGVRAAPLGETLGVPLDRSGRIVVAADLSVPGHPEIFVVGDLAHVTDARTGGPVPGVAPAAMQMGRHVAGIIAAEAAGRGGPRPAFRYRDKGSLATIGRARAVAAIGGFRFAGLAAWLLWGAVHILFLITFRQKLFVMLDWIWSYVTFTAGARLIYGGDADDGTRPAPAPPRT